jgi:hypothetical protein
LDLLHSYFQRLISARGADFRLYFLSEFGEIILRELIIGVFLPK